MEPQGPQLVTRLPSTTTEGIFQGTANDYVQWVLGVLGGVKSSYHMVGQTRCTLDGDAALRHPHSLLHVEHLTYLVAGICLWWPVIHSRRSAGAKAAYLFAAFVLASPLGLLLALIPRAIYPFYVHAPRTSGPSPLADQQIAGVTMAAEEALVFFGAFTAYLLRFLADEQAASGPRPGPRAARSPR